MKKILFIALTVGVVFSCQKEEANTNFDGDVFVGITTHAQTASASDVGATTRMIGGFVDGTQMFNFKEFSMWVESALFTATTTRYAGLGYDNIRVFNDQNNDLNSGNHDDGVNGNPNWYFLHRGAPLAYINRLAFSKGWGNVNLWAVYPYKAGFSSAGTGTVSMTAYPFDLNKQMGNSSINDTAEDIMVAGPVLVNVTGATDASGNLSVPAQVNFRHLMTAFDFRFKLTLPSYQTRRIDGIIAEVFDGSNNRVAKLGVKGTVDLKTGVFTVTNAVDSLVAYADLILMGYKEHIRNTIQENTDLDNWSAGQYQSVPIIVPPFDLPNGKIKFTLMFSRYNFDAATGTWIYETNELPNVNGSTLTLPVPAGGFIAGTRYVIKIQVDNFIRYVGYPVREEWKDGPTTPEIYF